MVARVVTMGVVLMMLTAMTVREMIITLGGGSRGRDANGRGGSRLVRTQQRQRR